MTLLLWLVRLVLPGLMVVGLLIDSRSQLEADDLESVTGLETELSLIHI